jgi:uncharacterized phage protein (TIGR01671 family)
MDRTIKFRAKRIDNNKWAYGGLIQADDYCIIDQGNELYVERDYNFRGDTHFFQLSGVMCDEKTVGQFTGLLDKNRKEIYEGDMIVVNDKYPKLVKYIDDYACFCLANIEDLDEKMDTGYWHQVSPGWWNSSKREIRVIGNMYDHPELIKEE